MEIDEAEKEWPQKLIRVKNRVNGFHFSELHMRDISLRSIYLLLAEFSVRTVNYGPSFFPSKGSEAPAINRSSRLL